MSSITLEENVSGLSVLKDPFAKGCVTRIVTDCGEPWFGSDKDKWNFRGRVYFKNGNTTGEQKFEGKDMADLTAKMAAFLNELEK